MRGFYRQHIVLAVTQECEVGRISHMYSSYKLDELKCSRVMCVCVCVCVCDVIQLFSVLFCVATDVSKFSLLDCYKQNA